MSNAKGFTDKELKQVISSTLGWRRSVKNLTRDEADLIKVKLAHMEAREVMENETKILNVKDIKSSTKRALQRSLRVYDVDDAELGDYIEAWSNSKGELTNHDVNRVIATIRAVNEMRPDKGRVIWAYLAPAKRLFGEKFMTVMRRSEVGRLEEMSPYERRIHELFGDLGLKSREAISDFFEGEVKKEQLSPQELKVAEGLRSLYNEMWKTFEIEGFVKDYSPHMKKNMSEQDFINWVFTRQGVSEFDFWAEHKRTGMLSDKERDAKKMAMSYIRAGLTKKYYGKAIEEIKPIMEGMSKERQALANKWIDTVIKRRPSADEIVMNRLLKKLLKNMGVKVDENARYYKQLLGTFLDFNYSAFMGMRPKLALRNLTQQILIMNEYGYGNYLKGRLGSIVKK